MKFDYIKNNKEFLSKGLLVVSAGLACLLVFKVAAFGYGSWRVESEIEKAIASSKHDEEAVKKSLAKYTDAANELKKKNLFAPPPAKPGPPRCTGILGDMAILNGKGYKVGEDAGGAKVVAIDAKEVTVMWDGKEMKLQPFKKVTFDKSSKPAAKKKETPQPAAAKPKTIEAVEQAENNVRERQRRPGRGRARMMNLSSEEREKIRNMSREERREYFSNR